VAALVYTTVDKGDSWPASAYPGGELLFLNEKVGWELGRDIHKTVDGGQTWTHARA
jgi:photosystem II stability/assembly factor-like uncharacterized protein